MKLAVGGVSSNDKLILVVDGERKVYNNMLVYDRLYIYLIYVCMFDVLSSLCLYYIYYIIPSFKYVVLLWYILGVATSNVCVIYVYMFGFSILYVSNISSIVTWAANMKSIVLSIMDIFIIALSILCLNNYQRI